MVPERDIRALGDTADPSLGVWFELCKGRNDSVCMCVCYFEEGVAVCFDYFLLEGDDLRGGGLAGTSLTGDSQTRAKRHRDKFIRL